MLKKFFKEDAGEGMVEYDLIIPLVAEVLVVMLTAMGGGLDKIFGKVTAELPE